MTENELLNELARELSVPEIESNEITVKMLAERLNVTGRTAYQQLMDMVEAGKLKKRYVKTKGSRKVLAFSKVE